MRMLKWANIFGNKFLARLDSYRWWFENDARFLILSLLSAIFIAFLCSRYPMGISISVFKYDEFIFYSFAKLLLCVAGIAYMVMHFFVGILAEPRRNRGSYFEFIVFIVFFLPIVMYVSRYFLLYDFNENAIGALAIFGFLLATLYAVLSRLCPNKSFDPMFAAETVGRGDDLLNYSESAKNHAFGIKDEKANVSVYGLYGSMGWGKSSYARMISEWLLDDDVLGVDSVLYTYISLTESNEAKDFSRLFAERCEKTITERYVKLCPHNLMMSMRSILRDDDGGLFKSFMSSYSSLNCALFYQTPWPNLNKSKTESIISRDMANFVGHVPAIIEKLWLIVIDEVERAPLDEIFRLVEILERFKFQGRTGVHVKIVFLLCVAYDELKEYVHKFVEKDDRANLLLDFFFDNPKNITRTLFLPPISDTIKTDMVMKEITKLVDELKIPIKWKWDGFKPSSLIDPLERDFIDEKPDVAAKRGMEWAVATVAWKSPRMCRRVLSEMNFFYLSYRNTNGVMRPEAINLCDIMMLSYLRIKYPEIIEFLKVTVNDLIPTDELSPRGLRLFVRDDKKEYSIFVWIKEEIDWEVPEDKKDEIKKIFGLCARGWLDTVNKVSVVKSAYRNRLSTSWPRSMKSYLASIEDNNSDDYKWVLDAFEQHRSGNKLVIGNEQSLGNVLDYAHTIRQLEGVESGMLMDILEILCQWLIQNKVPLRPCDTGSTFYDDVITQFAFYMTDVVERKMTSRKQTEVFERLWTMIDNILESTEIPLGVKYMLMNNFANLRSGGEIHYRMTGAFKSLMIDEDRKKRIILRFEAVFNERNCDYYNGAKVLYSNEENFFYVLYQGWSGNPTDSDEIINIRKVALRGLNGFPNAIKQYWAEWPSVSSVEEDDDYFGKRGTELYLPLRDLIQVTKDSKNGDEEILAKMKSWEDALKTMTEEDYQKKFSIKRDLNTLFAAYQRSLAS